MLIYEFSEFQISPERRLLIRNGAPVSLTPKGFDTLLFLVQNRGRVLEKHEFMGSLWPESFVEDGNLSQNIFVLRKLLGDDQNGARFIQTIPRRGYKFVASVKEIDTPVSEVAYLGQRQEYADSEQSGNTREDVGQAAEFSQEQPAASSLAANYWSQHSPFRSLQVFEPEDSWLFFGRNADTDELLARLGRSPVVVIVGNSGSGKSSLVRAGVIPALRQGRFRCEGSSVDSWRIALLRPSGSPFDYLAEILPGALAPELSLKEQAEFIENCRNKLPLGGNSLRNSIIALRSTTAQDVRQAHVLLVVDQFEEIFTLQISHATRKKYIDILLAASQVDSAIPVHLILVLRADFYANCLEYADLSRCLETNPFNAPRMTPSQLRETIEKRLALAMAYAEPGLIDSLLEDVGVEPGNLALLEHALGQLWDKCGGSGCTLTTKAYSEIGRLKGALSTHADEVYGRFSDEAQKQFVQRIFLELVHLGEDSQDTRRRVRKADLLCLGVPEEVETLLARLSFSRLISMSREGQETFVEVSHEALIREWSRLRDWITHNRDELRLGRRLVQAAQEWESLSKDPGALLQGARLAQAEEWLAKQEETPALLREFLQAGIDARSEAAWKDRKAQERELNQQKVTAVRLRRLFFVLSTTLLIAIGATWYARRQQFIAESRGLAVRAEQLVNQDQPAALTLAIHAWQTAKTAEAHIAVADSFPNLLATLQGHTDFVYGAVFSPDGQRVLTFSEDKTARVWNVGSGQLRATLPAHTSSILSAVFSPDGERILTAGGDKMARVWNASSGQLLATLPADTSYVYSADFSPDGQRILTAGGDKTARVWNVGNRQLLVTLQGHTGPVLRAVFSPDGQRILTASADKTARVWNANTGQPLVTLQGHTDPVLRAVFSPDGQRILTGSLDKTARVWNAGSGQLLLTLPFHTNYVLRAMFSPDGQRIVIPGDDKTARVWNAGSGQLLATLQGHTDFVNASEFSPDGQRILTSSLDKTARMWNAGNGQLLLTLHAVWDAQFSPDGQRILTITPKDTAQVWNATISAELLATLEGHNGPVSMTVISPDGQRIVTASADKTARVWNATSGQLLATLEGHAGPVIRAAFSPDGQRIATASDDKTLRVWNAGSGQLLLTVSGYTGSVDEARFSPDGQSILTVSWDRARVWNAASGQLLLTLPVWGAARFSPDGQRILTTSIDNTAQLWNAASGQLLLTLHGHTDSVREARFSPDGQRILTASDDETARVWNAGSGQLLVTLNGHSAFDNAVFSPDGQRILTTSKDNTAGVWNAGSGQLLVTLNGRFAFDNAVFSPDGQRILTTSKDNTARIWNAASGQLLVTLNDYSPFGNALFSPDGQRILTTTDGNTVEIFRLVPLAEVRELWVK
jgi:WD40 repeat protein/DNA-binding winged helix-turn-helix (wHTH) protein/energy-coupling factor transporter ATP-binding protein EcfA2